MRAGLLIICCSIIISACKNNNRTPAGIIAPPQMQAVLWDMMRADQFLVDFVLNKDSSLDKKTESVKLYMQIFDIHHINKEQFGKSFSYYQKHPSLLKEIMDSLSKPRNEAPAVMVKQPIPQDSNQVSPVRPPKYDSLINFRKKKLIHLK